MFFKIIENRGKTWHHGCYYRSAAGILLILLFLVMMVRYNGHVKRNEVRRKSIFGLNRILMIVSYLLMLFWIVYAVLSVYRWNHNSPINKFDNVSKDVSLDVVYGIPIVVAICFIVTCFSDYDLNCGKRQ